MQAQPARAKAAFVLRPSPNPLPEGEGKYEMKNGGFKLKCNFEISG